MSLFGRLRAEHQPGSVERRWLFAPYDQPSDRMGLLARKEPKSFGIALMENA